MTPKRFLEEVDKVGAHYIRAYPQTRQIKWLNDQGTPVTGDLNKFRRYAQSHSEELVHVFLEDFEEAKFEEVIFEEPKESKEAKTKPKPKRKRKKKTEETPND